MRDLTTYAGKWRWHGLPDPVPTDEEFAEAERRHRAACASDDSMSDFSISFAFAMATYSPFCWLEFVPNREELTAKHKNRFSQMLGAALSPNTVKVD